MKRSIFAIAALWLGAAAIAEAQPRFNGYPLFPTITDNSNTTCTSTNLPAAAAHSRGSAYVANTAATVVVLCYSNGANWITTAGATGGPGIAGPVGSAQKATLTGGGSSPAILTLTHNFGTVTHSPPLCSDANTLQEAVGWVWTSMGTTQDTITFNTAPAGGDSVTCYETSGGGLAMITGTAASIVAQLCSSGQVGFATDATPGLNLYYCNPANTWTQIAASPTIAGVVAVTSLATNGTTSGALALTSKTSGAISSITVPDALPAGAALSISSQDSGGTGTLETSISSCGVMDYTCAPMREEFWNTSNTAQAIGLYGWDLNLIGATGCTASNLAAYYPNLGIEHLATSATAARGCVLELDGGSGTVAMGNIFLTPFQSWWTAALNQLVTTPEFRIGFISGSASAAKPGGGGAYFCFDSSATGCGAAPDTTHWNACANTTGTEICASLGVAPLTFTITGASNANPIIINTASTTGLALNTNVVITGVGGNTNANGLCHISAIIANSSFTCGNLAGNAGYTSGGMAIPFYRFSISQAGAGIASFALYLNGTQSGSTVTICASGCTAAASLYPSLTPGLTLANGTTAETDNAYIDAFAFLAGGLVR